MKVNRTLTTTTVTENNNKQIQMDKTRLDLKSNQITE